MSFNKIREQSRSDSKSRVLNRAGGGKANKGHKAPKAGKTDVNVIVTPERGASAAPVGGGAGLSRAPVPPSSMGGGGLGGLGGGPAPMGTRPTGLKKGGRANRATGGRTYDAGASTGKGRLEKKDKYGQ
jgi:hypothetical protein